MIVLLQITLLDKEKVQDEILDLKTSKHLELVEKTKKNNEM